MANYVIPPIGSKGKFSFQSPFDTGTKKDTEYTVYSIRSIRELIDSGEDPLKYIYKNVGLSETEMNQDLEDNIPIVVLSSGTNSYVYVPANRISALPDVSGVKYQQKMLAINIGHLPLDYSLDIVKETVKEAVLEMTGIESTVQAIDTSAIKYITADEHTTYMKLIEGRKKSNMSYRTRYKILNNQYETLKKKLEELEKCIVTNNPTGFVPVEETTGD